MASLNRCCFIGGLKDDGELKQLSGDNKVYNNTLAVNDTFKDGKTQWLNIRAWGKLADLMKNYCGKGSQIYVDARVDIESWKDKEGNNKQRAVFVLNAVQFLSKAKSNDGQQSQSNGPANPGQMDDDLAF